MLFVCKIPARRVHGFYERLLARRLTLVFFSAKTPPTEGIPS